MEIIGEPVTEQELNEMLALADIDKDGRINYEGKRFFPTTTFFFNGSSCFAEFFRLLS